ncbi:MAG TPA: ABC transporter permease [Firmicutes bacterium]|jgi:putative aldouronate transport system permease protein|nr:ABC transporter permease [Bacillota bacterium]
MVENHSLGRKTFMVLNTLGLGLFAFLCLVPMIHIMALSFSSNMAAGAGEVKLLPVDLSLKAYEFVLNSAHFWQSFLVSIERILVGLPVELFLTIFTAYPLAKEKKDFPARSIYLWFLIISMLFQGGMISTFIVVKSTGLINHLLVLVIPQCINAFNILLMVNFFRNLPKEMIEAASIDGAGHWKILWSIYVPVAIPSIATITVFILVRHWNSWFDGLIYMNDISKYPLQTYLQSLVIQRDTNIMMTKEEAALMALISERTIKAAQVFIASLPILIVYPFLQRYFISGMLMGSVKG